MKPLPHTPRNILITHVYSSANKGDAALTSVLITDLCIQYPGATLTILKLVGVNPGDTFEGVPEQPSFMYYALNRYHNPLAKLCYTLYMLASTLLWAYWLGRTGKELYLPSHLRAVAHTYRDADLIVPVGGGYVRSRRGLANRLNIPLILHPILFAQLIGKPTVLYAQSAGPFQGHFEQWLVRRVLQKVPLIILREDTSAALLERMGITANVRRSVDSGFLLESRQKLGLREQYHLYDKQLLIGVTVRQWLSGAAQENYEKAVASALDAAIRDYNAHVLFIPQVTAANGDDDRLASHRVHSYMQQADAATEITDTPDHYTLKAMYGELDILLGTRFHSVIFSLTSYVPVLAIEYEHKTSGIMHDLGLDEWVIKIEQVTPKNLADSLTMLIMEQTSYRQQLHKVIPPYVKRAHQSIELLDESYQEFYKQHQRPAKPNATP